MTTDIDITQETEDGIFARREVRRAQLLRRLGTVLAAPVLALAVWAIAVPLAGLQLVAGTGATAQHIGPARVAVSAFALSLAAWALLALLERLGRRGRRIWQVTGWLVLALSLAGPVVMGGDPAVLAALLAMHLVVGATAILGLAHRSADA